MASILGFFSVSPACAGMIPPITGRCPAQFGEPRMRGDDPRHIADETASLQ